MSDFVTLCVVCALIGWSNHMHHKAIVELWGRVIELQRHFGITPEEDIEAEWKGGKR